MAVPTFNFITPQFQVIEILGKGGFGEVVSALDTHYQSMVAIKVVRKEDDAVQLAMEEIRQLEMLRPYYPEQHHCLRLLCWFWFEDHVCLVFPLLGKSVHDYMAMVNNDVFCCFTLDEVRHIGFQICSAMNFIHGIGIVHADIKPENIVFIDSSYTITREEDNTGRRSINRTDIQIIDFGLSIQLAGNELGNDTRGTRYYRAPEMCLGLLWSKPIDMWAVGCVLYELYAERRLFPGRNSHMLLAMMERALGRFPRNMIRVSSFGRQAFSSEGLVIKDGPTIEAVERACWPLANSFREGEVAEQDFKLYRLLQRLFKYRPEERISAEEALADDFFAH